MRLLITRLLRTTSLFRVSHPHTVLQGLFVRTLSSRISSRLYSSRYIYETLDVPVGGNGHVSLSIIQPEQSPNVILYLPPGPLFQFNNFNDVTDYNNNTSGGSSLGYEDNDAGALTPQHILAFTTSTTVVTVNYRLGQVGPWQGQTQIQNHPSVVKGKEEGAANPFYTYPNPIYDTLAGLDWILENLKPHRLGVFGTHIGGSLALMLALTEAQSVNAVAAFEPVCDWVGLDEYCIISLTSKGGGDTPIKLLPRRKNVAPPDLVPLLEARQKLFRSPQRYYDAFASPILFLRAAGSNVPKAFPKLLTSSEYPVPVLELSGLKKRHLDLWDVYTLSEEEEEERNASSDTPDDEKVIRRLKSLLRWPPYGLDYGLDGSSASSSSQGIGQLQLRLPWVRLFARSDPGNRRRASSRGAKSKSKNETVLAHQADEMVAVMRRACFWGREIGLANERVQMVRVPPETSPVTVEEEAGEWLKGVFDSEDEK